MHRIGGRNNYKHAQTHAQHTNTHQSIEHNTHRVELSVCMCLCVRIAMKCEIKYLAKSSNSVQQKKEEKCLFVILSIEAIGIRCCWNLNFHTNTYCSICNYIMYLFVVLPCWIEFGKWCECITWWNLYSWKRYIMMNQNQVENQFDGMSSIPLQI